MWKIICALLLAGAATAIYTNKQANECFEKAADEACEHSIKQCVDDPTCKAELSQFQDCSFGGEEAIFNGYCFRKWQARAAQTKQMIDCLVHECQLDYNSVIGTQELFECSQQAIIDNFGDCDEACMLQLNKIREDFYTTELTTLFAKPLEDQAASNIVEAIRRQCLDQEYVPEEPTNTQ